MTEERACHQILSASSEKSAEITRNNQAARLAICILSTDYVKPVFKTAFKRRLPCYH
jgi:hypothetical protein